MLKLDDDKSEDKTVKSIPRSKGGLTRNNKLGPRDYQALKKACFANHEKKRHRSERVKGPSDWTTSTRLRRSASFEFQTSDVSRALALHVGV